MSAARHVEAGITYEEKGDYEKALIHYQAAVEKEEGSIGIWVNLGNVYSQLKEYQKAEQYYRMVLHQEPHHAVANNNLAWIMVLQGENFEEAEGLIRDAMYSDPDRVAIYLDTQAHLYLHQRRYEEALQSAQAAANHLDRTDRALGEHVDGTLALILRAMGESRGADVPRMEFNLTPEGSP
jgi:tetratricopeptide (TPR) repeat protein